MPAPTLAEQALARHQDARDAFLIEQLRAAGRGHAIWYRLAASDRRDAIKYETHLVELDADGQVPEGLAGFHYVTLRDHA